ncbi:MAG: hypothetical protein JWN95_1898 [Frankiales bacterium]|nr:hypothetical protein [Frankiales bacterium]
MMLNFTAPVRVRLRQLACGTAAVALLAGCGGSAKTANPAASEGPNASSATQAGDLSALSSVASPSTGGAASSRVTSIDVCALLSPADAAAVARDRGLNGAQTAATKYSLTTTPQPGTNPNQPTSGCKFSIDGEGASGTVVILVQAAENFSLYSTDASKVPDLGDEAYDNGSSTVVRVGDLMLLTSENSFSDQFVADLYRKMVPNLK